MSSGEKLQIRRAHATEDDARVLAELGWRTFDATFAAVTPRADMDLFLEANYTTSKLLAELRDERNFFFVAETIAGDGAGYLKVSTQLDYVPSCVQVDSGGAAEKEKEKGEREGEGELVELARLYLEVQFKGMGLGSCFMKRVLAEAERLGAARIWLGVWEHNEAAKGFYERWGFRYVGSHPYPVGNDPQTDLLMVRDM